MIGESSQLRAQPSRVAFTSLVALRAVIGWGCKSTSAHGWGRHDLLQRCTVVGLFLASGVTARQDGKSTGLGIAHDAYYYLGVSFSPLGIYSSFPIFYFYAICPLNLYPVCSPFN
jgi:hypothetical protein